MPMLNIQIIQFLNKLSETNKYYHVFEYVDDSFVFTDLEKDQLALSYCQLKKS